MDCVSARRAQDEDASGHSAARDNARQPFGRKVALIRSYPAGSRSRRRVPRRVDGQKSGAARRAAAARRLVHVERAVEQQQPLDDGREHAAERDEGRQPALVLRVRCQSAASAAGSAAGRPTRSGAAAYASKLATWAGVEPTLPSRGIHCAPRSPPAGRAARICSSSTQRHRCCRHRCRVVLIGVCGHRLTACTARWRADSLSGAAGNAAASAAASAARVASRSVDSGSRACVARW